MLHALVHDRRLIAAALALALPLAAWAAPARADVAQVTVVSPGGAESTLALDALAGGEDVVERPYAVRWASGEKTETVTGFSLAALIEAAGADPYGFSYLEVQRPGGGAVLLSREQALDGEGYPDGPPVVYASAEGTGFLRPSAGGGDLNAGDCFTAPQGLTIVLAKGQPLQVRAKASPLRTKPGEKVSFEAIVERAGAGAELAYSWYFDDGHSASRASVTHSFAKRGSYDVVVGVTVGGEGTGASAVVTVQVGAPLGGPERKGGGKNKAKGAPDHGSAAGPSGDSSAAGRSSNAASGTSPASPPAQAPSKSRFQTDAERPKGTAKPADPKARFEADAQRPKGTTAPGERVEGEVLGAPVATAPAARQAAARSGSLEPAAEGGGPSVPAAAWGTLATLGLLGTGAALEAGGGAALRRRLGRRP